ncbi:hypothetical protein FQN54_008388 [Arachnomyces sp. PD_36]|nr:hypothetical protein FQN54_008388 [Arachnomyces sp. PD_36]
MLPDFLTSSYKRYKEDTNVFTTWLAQTAKSCGYHLETKPTSVPTETVNVPKGPRLKGKERKLAREAAKEKEKENEKLGTTSPANAQPSVTYAVTTQDILKQATAIVESGKRIPMPLNIQRVTLRAIEARQRCVDWFGQTGVGDDEATDGHEFFIQVLREAFEMVKGNGDHDSEDVDRVNGKPNGPPKLAEAASISWDMKNRFATLDLEDASEITPMDISTAATPRNQAPQKGEQQHIWELKAASALDIFFSVFCLYEDLHRIQMQIKKTWEKCQAGRLDIVSATVVTTAAFDCVRRAEEDINVALEALTPGAPPSVLETVSIVFNSIVSCKRERRSTNSVNPPKPINITRFTEFTYQQTVHTLSGFSRFHKFLKNYYAWPLPIPSSKATYKLEPDLLDTVDARQCEQDDRILSQLLLDILLQESLKQSPLARSKVPEAFLPFDDEFTSIIRTIWEKGKISVLAVFASRVLLDTIQVYKRDFKGMEMLNKENERVSEMFQFTSVGEFLCTGGGVTWTPEDEEVLRSIWEHFLVHTGNSPPFRRFKELNLENHERNPHTVPSSLADFFRQHRLNIDDPLLADGSPLTEKVFEGVIEPNPDLDFVVNCNPFYVGTLILNIAVLIEEAGVSLTNHQLSIFTTAHLYNALHQVGVCKARWPVLEIFIQKNMGPLFADDIPTTPETFYSRLKYRLREYTYGPGGRRFDKKGRGKVHGSPAAQTLRGFFSREANKVEKTLAELDEQIRRRKLDTNISNSKKPAGKRKLTPLEFLTALEDYMPAAMSDITIDYIGLTRACYILMNFISGTLYLELGVGDPPIQVSIGNYRDYTPMALDILEDTSKEFRRQKKKPKDVEPFKGGPLLKVAGIAFGVFMAEMAGKESPK